MFTSQSGVETNVYSLVGVPGAQRPVLRQNILFPRQQLLSLKERMVLDTGFPQGFARSVI